MGKRLSVQTVYYRMLVSKNNDEDYPTIVKKKPRAKKPRHKFSMIHSIPIKVLNTASTSTTTGKKGKRLGFTVYDSLTCKQCKPQISFHKRFGLSTHSKETHRSNIVFKVPSIPQRSFSIPTRNTRSVSQVKNFTSFNRRLPIRKNSAHSVEIELIDLDDEDTKRGDDDEITVLDDDEFSGVNNKETKIKVSKPPAKSAPPKDEFDIGMKNKKAVDDDSDDEIECIQVIEVNENRIRTFEPKDYRWMESSPLYQPKVFLLNSLNIKIREETEEEVEELNPLDDPNLSSYLYDHDVLVELDDSVTIETVDDGEVNVLGDAHPVQLEEVVFDKASHIRNLFEEEQSNKLKRKSLLLESSTSKRLKSGHEEELLLFEEPDENVPDITSMLEVSLEGDVANESNTNEIEIVELEETTEKDSVPDINSMLEVSLNEGKPVYEGDTDEIEVVDLEETTSISTEEKKESMLVDLEESPECEVEIVSIDDENEQNQEVEPRIQEFEDKPNSIKDLVSQWAREEEATVNKKAADPTFQPRTKKRRSELKPRGL